MGSTKKSRRNRNAKALALALLMVMALALAGCGGNSGSSGSGSGSGSGTSQNSGSSAAAADFDWPDSEYTKAIPKPDVAPDSLKVDDDRLYATFDEAEYKEVRQYGDKLKAAGVTVDLNIFDEPEEYGMYMYMGGTGSGYFVDLQWKEGMGATLEVTKAD